MDNWPPAHSNGLLCRPTRRSRREKKPQVFYVAEPAVSPKSVSRDIKKETRRKKVNRPGKKQVKGPRGKAGQRGKKAQGRGGAVKPRKRAQNKRKYGARPEGQSLKKGIWKDDL